MEQFFYTPHTLCLYVCLNVMSRYERSNYRFLICQSWHINCDSCHSAVSFSEGGVAKKLGSFPLRLLWVIDSNNSALVRVVLFQYFKKSYICLVSMSPHQGVREVVICWLQCLLLWNDRLCLSPKKKRQRLERKPDYEPQVVASVMSSVSDLVLLLCLVLPRLIGSYNHIVVFSTDYHSSIVYRSWSVIVAAENGDTIFTY